MTAFLLRSAPPAALCCLLAASGAANTGAAGKPAESAAGKGELLFSDDFERGDLGEWKTVIPAFSVRDGVLIGWQERADHGAVGRIHRPMKDVVVEFKFRLEGSATFNAVFDDQNFKGSHAGHICRVAFTQKAIRLGDDREGIMRNDIYEMRKDPARKAEAGGLIQGRSTQTPVTLGQNKWYQVAIEITGDRMCVSLDGKPAAELVSPGIAHETKTSFHFTVTGPCVHFDDVRIWKAGSTAPPSGQGS
jgi:hypothetical protein